MQSGLCKLIGCLKELSLSELSRRDVGDDTSDKHAAVSPNLGAHPVEHRARSAVVPDEPILNFSGLAIGEPRGRRAVCLAIVWMHRRLVGVLV